MSIKDMIISTWEHLENVSFDGGILEILVNECPIITINNRNPQRLLEVYLYFRSSSKETYTHIHSLLNDIDDDHIIKVNGLRCNFQNSCDGVKRKQEDNNKEIRNKRCKIEC